MNIFTREQIAEITAANKQAPERIIPRKLQAVKLAVDGMENAEIAKHTEYHKKYVSLIICEYKRKGLKTLCDNRPGGNHRTFTVEKEEELFGNVSAEANDGRFPRMQEIREEVEKLAGKSIPQSTFYKMARRQHGRKLKPRGANPKKGTDSDIESAKKYTL